MTDELEQPTEAQAEQGNITNLEYESEGEESEEDEEEEEEEEDEFEFGEMNDEEILSHLQMEFSGADLEDLFNKNTSSFRCLRQILISRSSLLRMILYHFPPLEDPGIDEVFNYVEPEAVTDDIGAEKYKTLAKEFGIVPISRVTRSLPTDTLNLKYYGLSLGQIKALCTTLMLNTHIKTLILQDNWMSPEAVYWLGEMLRENNSIKVLNLSECRIGPKGAQNIAEGLSLNQAVTELDLSFNNLGDDGVKTIIDAIKANQLIQKLNLGHNSLGEGAAKCLGEFLATNSSIDWLDLSWNDLYSPLAMKLLCNGLSQNIGIEDLNLSWNAIGTNQAVLSILKFLKNNSCIKHLDLSNNRLLGEMLKMIKAGIVKNDSLLSINLGFNLITPEDAMLLIGAFFATRDEPLQLEYMDLENVFVYKNFINQWKKVTNMGKSVRIQGVLSDYTIKGPNKKQLLFKRCMYLAQKPKKKKKKRNFGHFIYSLPDALMDKKDFAKAIKKFKLKLDVDLIAEIVNTFKFKKSDNIDLVQMKKSFLDMFPDTEPPPPKPKKKKRKKKGKKGKKKSKSVATEKIIVPEQAKPPTETKTTETSNEEEPENTLAEIKQKSATEQLMEIIRSQTSMKDEGEYSEEEETEKFSSAPDVSKEATEKMSRSSFRRERPRQASTVSFKADLPNAEQIETNERISTGFILSKSFSEKSDFVNVPDVNEPIAKKSIANEDPANEPIANVPIETNLTANEPIANESTMNNPAITTEE